MIQNSRKGSLLKHGDSDHSIDSNSSKKVFNAKSVLKSQGSLIPLSIRNDPNPLQRVNTHNLSPRADNPSLFRNQTPTFNLEGIKPSGSFTQRIQPKLINHPKYRLEYSQAALHLINKIKTSRDIQYDNINDLRQSFRENEEKKFTKFKKVLLKNSFFENDPDIIKQSNKNIQKIFKSVTKIKPVYYESTGNRKQFQWDAKIVDKKIIPKRNKEIIKDRLNDIPDWLKDNADFVKSFKQGLALEKSEIIEIAMKEWYHRSPYEISAIELYLQQLQCLAGFDDIFFKMVSKEVGAAKLQVNSYLFEKNKKTKYVYILNDGIVRNEQTGEIFKKGEIISKKILEDKEIVVEDNYIVVKEATVLKISKELYLKFCNLTLKNEKYNITNKLRSTLILKEFSDSQFDHIVQNCILRYRHHGEGKMK